jgi:SapC
LTKFVPINTSCHTGKAWRRFQSYGFASAQDVIPLAGAEFGKAAAAMPIAFVQQSGGYVPVAVMSPIAGRNFFIGPAGQWLGTYVPAALRCYPFRLLGLEGSEGSFLCIDEDSGLVVDANGTAEDFFDADGNPSPVIKAVRDFVWEIERNRTLTDRAVAAIAETGLIQPWPLSVKVGEQTTPLNGIFRIDEAAMNTLDDADFLKLRKFGSLPLAYMQLLSMSQVSVFEQLNRIQQQLTAKTEWQFSLEEIFTTTDSGILRFN